MAKSRHEQQLEDMTAERDHWRRAAQQRGQELAEAKRRLERQDIHLRRIMRGAKGDDEEIERIQLERDQVAESWRGLAQDWIDHTEKNVLPSLEQSLENIDDLFFADAPGLTSVPALVRVLRYAIDDELRFTEQKYDKYDAQLELYGVHSPDRDGFGSMIFDIIRQARRITIYEVGHYLKAWAWGKSKDPALLAHQVLEQWEAGKPVAYGVLYVLWSDGEPGPGLPGKPATMIKALEYVRQAQELGSKHPDWSELDFAQELGVDPRTLKNHRNHVAALRQLASQAAQKLK